MTVAILATEQCTESGAEVVLVKGASGGRGA